MPAFEIPGTGASDRHRTPEEDLVFTTNGVSSDVSAIGVKLLKVIETIEVGRFHWGATIQATKLASESRRYPDAAVGELVHLGPMRAVLRRSPAGH